MRPTRVIRSMVSRAAAVIAVTMAISGITRAAETRLERGTYLMQSIVACGNCHTPKGPDGQALTGRELSGGFVIDAPAFHSVAPNITPDIETGIGGWTGAQIADAIRNGKRPDGSTIGPPMPIAFYRDMSDTDVLAIVAYLRSVKPISNKIEKSSYKIPLPAAYGPVVSHVADVPQGNTAAYGQYLSAIGHCMECHTPMIDGRPDMVRIGAGGRELPAIPAGTVVSANLTAANPDGIAHWPDAAVKETMTTGVRPDGRRLVRLMAFDWYKNIDPIDLDALVTYLRTLPPVSPVSAESK